MRVSLGRGLGLALLLAIACDGDTGGPGGNEGTVTMRMMNAADGGAALDLIVGGEVIAGAVPYERASALATVPGGMQTLAVRRSGQPGILATRSLDLIPGAKYTVVASGSLASLVLTPSAVVDTGHAKPDRANIRIINISTIVMPQDSSSTPPPIFLNVYITAPGVSLDGAVSPLSLDARISSYSTLIYFDPGTYVARFVTPGTTSVVAETPAIPIAGGQVRAVTLQRGDDGSWRTSVVVEE